MIVVDSRRKSLVSACTAVIHKWIVVMIKKKELGAE